MNQAQLRRAVLLRDGGICTFCRCDTGAVMAAYHAEQDRLKAECHSAVLVLPMEVQRIQASHLYAGALLAVSGRLRALGFSPGCAPWQVHHLKSLEEGGLHTLENSATACTPCHKRESAVQAGQRARKPSKRLAVIGVDRGGKTKIW